MAMAIELVLMTGDIKGGSGTNKKADRMVKENDKNLQNLRG
jgi:hypothetical protein